jgi:hypothetical protein
MTPNKPGLTRETFLALRHTCLALADCATYLIDQLAFDVVMLGYLQSDPIESRFGWLRQMSGANYYISAKQVQDSDRKIRAVSLLKFSHMSLSEIDSAISTLSSDTHENSANYDVVADELNDNLLFRLSPTASDLNVIFYVSGYIARSVCRTTRCDHCNEALSNSEDIPPLTVDDDLPYASRAFFDSVNRGGLENANRIHNFSLTVHCWKVYEEIRAHSELMTKFLTVQNHNYLFYKIMDRATCHPSIIDCGFNNYMCTQGHNITQLVVQRFFNCVAKNLVRHLTNAANQHGEPSSKRRKIAKLVSKTLE